MNRILYTGCGEHTVAEPGTVNTNFWVWTVNARPMKNLHCVFQQRRITNVRKFWFSSSQVEQAIDISRERKSATFSSICNWYLYAESALQIAYYNELNKK